MSSVLVIEDEENLARFVELELQHEGYETHVEDNGRGGLDAALASDYDLILLDLMLPELSGLEVARRLREEKNTPIIMMTARDSVIDRVSGLDYGADDYVVKPFAIEELLARVRALLRRIDIETEEHSTHQSVVRYRDLTVEKENRIARRGNEIINLTKREYELLLILMENINVVQSREELLKKVWGYDSEIETNVVDVYIRYLRNKIDQPDSRASYIQTVRGTGYVMRVFPYPSMCD
jgi:DNA-binding response OmpR family regulator